MYERDDYAASQRRGTGCGLWFVWLLATTLGAALGFMGSQLVYGALSGFLGDDPDLLPLVLASVPAGAVLGAVIGAAQGLVLLRYIGTLGWRDWVLASVLGGTLRGLIVVPIGHLLAVNLRVGFPVCDVLFTLIAFGALSGVAFALPQSVVLQRCLGHATSVDRPAWVLANAGGGVLGLPVVSLSGLTGSALLGMGVVDATHATGALIAAAIAGLVTGIITGMPLLDRLRYSVQA